MKALETEFKDFMKRVYRSLGFDNITSTIMSILYSETDEISLDEIAQKTGYSLASISNKVRLLENIGVIQRSKKPKSKKVYLFMEKDVFVIQESKIVAARSKLINPSLSFLPPFLEKYSKLKKTEKEKKQYDNINLLYKRMKQMNGLLEDFLKSMREYREK